MCVKSITLIATQTCVSDTHEYVCDPQLVPYMTCSRLDNRHTMECGLKIAEAATTTASMYVTMYIYDYRQKNILYSSTQFIATIFFNLCNNRADALDYVVACNIEPLLAFRFRLSCRRRLRVERIMR